MDHLQRQSFAPLYLSTGPAAAWSRRQAMLGAAPWRNGVEKKGHFLCEKVDPLCGDKKLICKWNETIIITTTEAVFWRLLHLRTRGLRLKKQAAIYKGFVKCMLSVSLEMEGTLVFTGILELYSVLTCVRHHKKQRSLIFWPAYK